MTRERSATWSADGGGSANQSSVYASSEAIKKSSSSARAGQLLVEGERRDRAGRVVRVVDPDDRGALVERASRSGRKPFSRTSGSVAPLRPRRARRARTRDTRARRTRRRACRSPGRRAPGRARRSPPSSRTSGSAPCPDRARRRTAARTSAAADSRSSGRPAASGYGARSGSASISAWRIIGSVGSFGSPLPKSITSTPRAASSRRVSSSRTNGYVAIPASVGLMHREEGYAASRSDVEVLDRDLLVEPVRVARSAPGRS